VVEASRETNEGQREAVSVKTIYYPNGSKETLVDGICTRIEYASTGDVVHFALVDGKYEVVQVDTHDGLHFDYRQGEPVKHKLFTTNAMVADPDHLIFLQDGQVVARVGAKFDFSKCPAELYQLALQILRPQQCALPSQTEAINEEPKQGRVRQFIDKWSFLLLPLAFATLVIAIALLPLFLGF
jgi:hypothetical protein